MTTMSKCIVKCSVCGTEKQVHEISSTSTFGYELDFRPSKSSPSRGLELMIQECANCGYVSRSLDNELGIGADYLNSDEYVNCGGVESEDSSVRQFIKLALINKQRNDDKGAMYSWTCAAWAADDGKDEKCADTCRAKALEYIEKLLDTDTEAKERENLILIKADMLRRTKQFSLLESEYSGLKFNDKLPRTIIRYQMAKAAEKYTGPLLLQDAKEFVEDNLRHIARISAKCQMEAKIYSNALAYMSEMYISNSKATSRKAIIHSTEVAEILATQGYSLDFQIAGLFHSLLKDSDATEEEIAEFGGEKVLNAVRLLTDIEHDGIDSHGWKIKDNEIAAAVKLADCYFHIQDMLEELSNEDQSVRFSSILRGGQKKLSSRELSKKYSSVDVRSVLLEQIRVCVVLYSRVSNLETSLYDLIHRMREQAPLCEALFPYLPYLKERRRQNRVEYVNWHGDNIKHVTAQFDNVLSDFLHVTHFIGAGHLSNVTIEDKQNCQPVSERISKDYRALDFVFIGMYKPSTMNSLWQMLHSYTNIWNAYEDKDKLALAQAVETGLIYAIVLKMQEHCNANKERFVAEYGSAKIFM